MMVTLMALVVKMLVVMASIKTRNNRTWSKSVPTSEMIISYFKICDGISVYWMEKDVNTRRQESDNQASRVSRYGFKRP
jgi:hypothetical protein